MEIKKIHDIDIYINEKKADIYSQNDLNLRFNNTFADPSKITSIQTEYSFSFDLPITKQNEKIFDYANILSKRNKFNKRYKTHVNVDGILIFDGELILTNVSKDGYKCNLYINRLNTVDKIFGDSVLSDITGWTMPYNQDVTINEINSNEDIKYPDNDVFFPLVSYGMFQKYPTSNDTYTSKYLIDDYSVLYNENFYPSINLLKTVKKCFQHKGYDVEGDIFDEEVVKRIYMSTSLSSEQDPIYNYGYANMGKFEMVFDFQNYATAATSSYTEYHSATSIEVTLDTPKCYIGPSSDGIKYYNFEKINVYDVWSSNEYLFKNITFLTKNNILWRKNRLVAPVDGFYKISLELPYKIDQDTQFVRYVYGREFDGTRLGKVVREEIPTGDTWTFKDFYTEFQLVKNSADGTDVKMIVPDSVDIAKESNYNEYSAYPHEKPQSYTLSSPDDPYPYGYIPQNGAVLGYDPRVNPNFIMGCTTSGVYKYTSVIKNGKSWDNTCSDTNESRYTSKPYYGIKVLAKETPSANRGDRWYAEPEITSGDNIYGVNTLPNSEPASVFLESYANVRLEAIVYLKKNDYLQLKMVQRQWLNKDDVDNEESGNTTSSRYRYVGQNDANIILSRAKVTFECFSPSDISINSSYMDWNNESRFPKELDIAQFLSNEEKMSDFVNNFIKEFNLSYSQNGNIITLNKQKIDFGVKNSVFLTDRVSENEIESEYIEFPSQISVQYTINEEERGFYISAEKNATDEQIQSNNWKDYADRGYDIIKITEDEYADESKVTTKTSYNWYEQFKITQSGQDSDINIPIIAKDEWMIDAYKDAEYMKEDGLSYTRRYWIPSELTDAYILLNGDSNRKVKIKLCKNDYDKCDLSYKKSNGKNDTLLTKYFNTFLNTDSNYITFECYLTTEEYLMIKNGANVIVDDDVYLVIEIQGYDCSGKNKTNIKCIKK